MTVCFGPGYKEQVLDQYEVNEISDLLLKYPNLSAVQNIIDQATYQIGRDFNIIITTVDGFHQEHKISSEGISEINLSNGTSLYIKVEHLITSNGLCYKYNLKSSRNDYLALHFTLQQKNSHQAKKLQIIMTSEINTAGIIGYKWYEGKEKIFETKFGTNYYPNINVNLRRIEYLEETSKCSKTSTFYECWGSRINNANFGWCSRPCVPIYYQHYGNITLPYCITKWDYDCALPIIHANGYNSTKNWSK